MPKDRLPDFSRVGVQGLKQAGPLIRKPASELLKLVVGDTGFEPVTSSVSSNDHDSLICRDLAYQQRKQFLSVR